MNNLATFTMTGWIRPGTRATDRIGLWGQNDAVEFGFVNPNTLLLSTAGGGSLSVPYDYSDNQWHQLSAVGDGQGLKIYIDGQLAGSSTQATANYGSSTYPFRVGGGGIFDPSGNYYTGDVDEVAVFSTALTADQIRKLYRAGHDGIGGSRPAAYWDFDDTLADGSGNGHAATASGTEFSNNVPPSSPPAIP